MKKLISVFVLILLVGSCTKKPVASDPICKMVFKATAGAASLVATTLQCENIGAIAADLSEPILKMGLCAETTAQTSIAEIVCPQLSTLITALTVNAIPASWQCSATVISDMLKGQIAETCAKVVIQ
jgi:hypothetical protein